MFSCTLTFVITFGEGVIILIYLISFIDLMIINYVHIQDLHKTIRLVFRDYDVL